jgi:hypothetical protein
MIARQASVALGAVPIDQALRERELGGAEPRWSALEWRGEVRLDLDRAAGISAARWQQQVRVGLLERLVALGFAHRVGSHLQRPDVAPRLLAHIDALAEAGLSLDELRHFSEDADLARPGALWALGLLHGCLDVPDAADAFEAWIESLELSRLQTYEPLLEIADALVTQPNPALHESARRWLAGRSAVLAAIALEACSPEDLSDDALAAVAMNDSPLVDVALARVLGRLAGHKRRIPRHRSWIELPTSALSYEAARARLLAQDDEPLARVREGDAAALEALGPYALDVLALAGEAGDHEHAERILRAQPTTARLLDAVGRFGSPLLFPRLMAELESDEFEDDAHRALVTVLGPRVSRPSLAAWQDEIAVALRDVVGILRLRGGMAHSRHAVLEEMKRPDLAAIELRVRAEETCLAAGRPATLEWEAFGASLEGLIAELGRLGR